MNTNKQSVIIITAAIFTSMPRWIISLLAGEGIIIPEDWKSMWIVISAILAAGMAVVEGFAFAFIFRAWRNQHGKAANTLLFLAVASAIAFVMVLSPSMAASVRGIPIGDFLVHNVALLLWTTSVALSTILIVISVGYSERVSNIDPQLQQARSENKDLRAELKKVKLELSKQNDWAWISSGSKRDKILKAKELWPDLSNKSLAIMFDTSDSYISQVVK